MSPESGAPDVVTDVASAVEAAIGVAIGRLIGPDENFFDAGLTSLALVRIHTECTRALAAPPPVTAMFAHPNLRALRTFLGQGGGEHTSRTARRGVATRRDRRRRTGPEEDW